jgi:PAS domain S-box-containing protein
MGAAVSVVTVDERVVGLTRAGNECDDFSSYVREALPLVAALTGSVAAAVVRRSGDGWMVDASTGAPYPTEGAAEALVGTLDDGAEVAGWCGVALSRAVRLPGEGLVLLLADPSEDAAWGPVALDSFRGAWGRLVAESRLTDLSNRVDNAQQLAGMGDYDWHIPTDTNRWSDQLYRIYGHEPQSFNASYEKFLSMLHPEDRERIMSVHQAAYASGEPYQMIERVVRPSGELRYLSSNGQVIMNDEGVPVRMRGTCVDITDRVLAEQERERSTQRFRLLVESSPDAVLVLDADGVVLQANERADEMLGGDPVGHSIGELLPEPARVGGEAIEAFGFDGRALRLDAAMANLADETEPGLTAAFLHDAAPRLAAEETAQRLRDAQLRRRQALEINDNVVQGLTIAVYAIEDGDYDRAVSYLDRTLAAGRKMMNDLLEPLEDGSLMPGGLVRSVATSLDLPDRVAPAEAAP